MTTPTCHPDRPHRAKGLCSPCYVMSRPEYGLRRIPRSTLARLLEAQGGRCRYCGDPLALADATIDHVVPRRLGGSDDEANLVACCKPCNSRKWANLPPEGVGGAYGPATKPRDERAAAAAAGELTLAVAAIELGVAQVTLRAAVERGRIVGRKVGRSWVLTRSQVDRYRSESLGKPGRPKGR